MHKYFENENYDDIVYDEYDREFFTQVCEFHKLEKEPIRPEDNAPGPDLFCGRRGCTEEAEHYLIIDAEELAKFNARPRRKIGFDAADPESESKTVLIVHVGRQHEFDLLQALRGPFPIFLPGLTITPAASTEAFVPPMLDAKRAMDGLLLSVEKAIRSCTSFMTEYDKAPESARMHKREVNYLWGYPFGKSDRGAAKLMKKLKGRKYVACTE